MTLNPLEQINLITMGTIAVIFTIAVMVLRRILLVPLITLMEQREQKFEHVRRRQQEADALVRKARSEADIIVKEAEAQARQLSKTVEEELLKMRDERCATAADAAEDILVRGREEVGQLRQEERAKLKTHLEACCKNVLAKLIGEVDEDTLLVVVNRVVEAEGEASQP
jgi:F0F1-type ATP synthase membrane subunit b/b'